MIRQIIHQLLKCVFLKHHGFSQAPSGRNIRGRLKDPWGNCKILRTSNPKCRPPNPNLCWYSKALRTLKLDKCLEALSSQRFPTICLSEMGWAVETRALGLNKSPIFNKSDVAMPCCVGGSRQIGHFTVFIWWTHWSDLFIWTNPMIGNRQRMLACIFNREPSSPWGKHDTSLHMQVHSNPVTSLLQYLLKKTSFVYGNIICFFRLLKDVVFIFLLIYYLDLHTHPSSIPKWQHVIDNVTSFVETCSEPL